MRFIKAKCKVLHLGWSNSPYQHKLGDEGIKSSPAKRDMGVLVGGKVSPNLAMCTRSPEHQSCPRL